MPTLRRHRPHRRHRRRQAAIAAGPVALAATMAGCGPGGAKPDLAALEAGTVPTSVPAGTTLQVADQLDFLQTVMKASGQDAAFTYRVVYSNFVGGPPMLQAFEAGSVDLGFIATTPAIFAQAAHQNIVAVAGWGTPNSSIALVTAPGRNNRNIAGWADLKGKKVAFQQGTVEESALLEGLQSVGLTLKDITPVNLALTSVTPALESGAVDAGILVEPLTAAYLLKEPSARVVAGAKALTDRSEFLIAATPALANRAKEAAIGDYITRVVKAYEWINAHPQQWAQDLYVDQYKVPLAEGVRLVEQAGPSTFYSLPGPIEQSQQNLADLFAQAGEIPTRENVGAEFTTIFNSVVARAQTS